MDYTFQNTFAHYNYYLASNYISYLNYLQTGNPNVPNVYGQQNDVRYQSNFILTPPVLNVLPELGLPGSTLTENVTCQKKEQPHSSTSNLKDCESRIPQMKNNGRGFKLQKENRNVISNLLRVLLKNILEVQLYDDFIEHLIQKKNLKIDREQFFTWIQGFKINYKNYIKPKEMHKILKAKNSEQFLYIFRVLARKFTNQLGVTHCLTSKRLNRDCSRRHIEGLRDLELLGQLVQE